MKKLELYKMEKIEGGSISPRDCLFLGAGFTAFLLSGELELATGTFFGAVASGCV